MTADGLPGPRFLKDLAVVAIGMGVVGALSMRKRNAATSVRLGSRSLNDVLRKKPPRRRKPPEAGMASPVVPPSGPFPKQGGAQAPLHFERDEPGKS